LEWFETRINNFGSKGTAKMIYFATKYLRIVLNLIKVLPLEDIEKIKTQLEASSKDIEVGLGN
jgi:hypothetical protein